MLSPAKIEAYRRMSPRERWRETIILMEVGWRTLQALPAAERERRLEILRAQSEASDQALLDALRRLR